MVGAGGAVAFSPYEVGDTFGIAKVGDLGGVEIQTPSGPVWTDAWGNAVIPGLTAYGESSVEISTASLPRNANLPNGVQSVKPARGSCRCWTSICGRSSATCCPPSWRPTGSRWLNAYR